ncbi:sialate O-acetylesterase [Flaviramulus basaltis]|uniref:Sialate O-acetylesterase n=1 Tax=Flaviramulus basaltis TaxID=369401 RepID=A0A1K2IN11_9FLAO|nr:sialate O-acetylesterase [Flaviramulus basaltis]SFZ93592.1 sialate O-acetylesterase [Flaviramulus basaltis]
MKIKDIFLGIIILFYTVSTYGQLKLPQIISSNMVLQQNELISVWGWAISNKEVIVKVSWNDKIYTSISDKTGKWKLKIKTPATDGNPQKITIFSETESILLENILLGEVWLCSGQSNMEMPMKGFKGQPVYGGNSAVAQSFNKNLRLFDAGKNVSLTPVDTLIGSTKWKIAEPESVATFSAVAYFYGSQLQKALKVPIGIITSCWGGTPIESWMGEDAHKNAKVIDLNGFTWSKKKQRTPTVLFNGMINPLIPFSIKGTLWYQGEANSREYQEDYKKTLPAMVNDWRKKFEVGEFPFYFVQIAPFKYDKNVITAPYMRSVMMECVDVIPNSGIVVTTDLGSEDYIHPPFKKEVADRLFYLAMNKTYGYKAIDCEGPMYEGVTFEEDKAIITFKEDNEGLYSPENNILGFKIASIDKKFYDAKALISEDRKSVQVWCDSVKKPVAVRYAWGNYTKASFFDNSMLPASSFRTDKW